MAKVPSLRPRIQRLMCQRVTVISTSTERLRGWSLQQRNRRDLAEDPLCRTCAALGRVTAAVEIDHIVPLHCGGSDERHNRQSLCGPCHAAKTAAEAKGRGGANV